MQGEDPRDYDPVMGIVSGLITGITPPDWAARRPRRIPNRYKATKAKLSIIEIQIVNIAHYQPTSNV